MCFTGKLEEELDEANFIIEFLYDALGPGADDIIAMANEAYEEHKEMLRRMRDD